jgi:phage tail sheath gpL-like
MATIGITGLSAGDMTPGVYVDLQLGVGESAGFQGVRNILLLGQKVSTAPGVDGQVYGPDTTLAVTSESDVISLYGAGSEIHKMYAMVVAINKVTPVYTLSVAPGTSATAATGTITVSTTTITQGGSLVIWVADQAVEVPILTSSTPTSIAADAVLAINAANMMVTASAALGVITITTRNKGLRFNQIKYQAGSRSSC